MRRIASFIILTFTSLLSNENLSTSFLSELKQNSFELERNLAKSSSDKLENSWINQVNLSYDYSINNQSDDELQHTQMVSISVNQPIFKSGGIYYAIKYAKGVRERDGVEIDYRERELIKSVVSTLFSIRELDYRIEKQSLLLSNAEIDLQRKEEQYREGLLDSSFLDSSLISKNGVELAKIELENQKKELLIKLKEISDVDYKNVELPHFELVSQEKFIKDDLSLKKASLDVETKRLYKKMQFSRYLPTFEFNGGYYYQKIENPVFGGQSASNFGMADYEMDYYQVGLKIKIPLIDLNRGYDNELAQVDYLKSQVSVKEKRRSLETKYLLSLERLKNIDAKIELAKSNFELYSRLVKDTDSLYRAGQKTILDVQNLQNSRDIQRLELKIQQINREKLLLELI